MISSSHTRKEDAKIIRKDVNKSPVTLSLGSKPLIKHRFYLDVKNRLTANKLETKIKELGGVLELFLIKEVTHVITDREEWCSTKGGGFTPKTPQSGTNESCSNEFNSFESTPTRGRPKTRADAMLERARKSSTIVTKDPCEEARNWGITIWTVGKAFLWLEKVTLSIKVSVKKTNYKVFELKAPYIKFEAFDRATRPVFQEIRNWPTLNFQGSAGDPGVICRSSVERTMTRKTRSNHPRVDTALQPGYCEVCRVEYPRLDEHLESEKHLNFVKDNSNFIELDSLISSKANIDTFLKLNGITNIGKVNGVTFENIRVMRNKMPRTRTISLCDKIKNSPLSPTGSDSGHRLRSRRHIAIANSYLGSTAEDDGQPIKPEGAREIRELRSSTRQLLKLVEHESKDTWDSGRPKRTCIKQKRISADERLVVDNKTYYKVEVLSSKLRSSGLSIKDNESAKRVQTPIPEVQVEEKEQDEAEEQQDSAKALIVKFKRMRSSELKQLNNEAENFLFPRKDESSSEDDIDGEGPDTTASMREGDSTLLLSSEPEDNGKLGDNDELKHEDEVSMDSNWSETSSIKKKKRRTHAEAFILDNQKYYKFETPGSRLRYQGSYLPPLVPPCMKSPKHNGEHPSKNIKGEEKDNRRRSDVKKEQIKKEKVDKKVDIKKEKADLKKEKSDVKKEKGDVKKEKGDVKKEKTDSKKEKSVSNENEKTKTNGINLKNLTYSFERVPNSEPWYCTFRRQDEGQEYYRSFSEPGCTRPFLLPYQMGQIPPLDPRVCINAYQVVKKQFVDPPSASTSAGSNTPDPHNSESNQPEYSEEYSEDSNITLEARNDEEVSALDIDDQTARYKRRRGPLVGKNPRKSPRQHASTLAILSSIIHQRKKRGDLNKSKSSDLNSSKQNLPSIAETTDEIKSDSQDAESDSDPLRSLADALEPFDIDELELSYEEIPVINVNFKLNAIDILDDYDRVQQKEITKSPVKRMYGPGKKPGRKKKKKNRTGWPNKSYRRHKKDIVKEEDIESTVDSISVNADSDDNEDNCDAVNSATDLNGDVNSIKTGRELGITKLNNNVNNKIEIVYNKTDQSNTQLIVNNSENVQTSKLETENSFTGKRDRVIASCEKDSCTDIVIPSVKDKIDRVVDLEKWENAEKVLSAKLTNNEINNDIQFQPYVRVQKLDSDVAIKNINRRLRSSSSPHRTVKRARRMPASPKSPRMLRKPRGRWYRER